MIIYVLCFGKYIVQNTHSPNEDFYNLETQEIIKAKDIPIGLWIRRIENRPNRQKRIYGVVFSYMETINFNRILIDGSEYLLKHNSNANLIIGKKDVL